MPLRPDDVVRKSFSTSILRRGYDEKQVDAFLDEVVSELRRLYDRIDELEAEAASFVARTPADEMSERVHREQQQIDLIRAERRDLVSELAGVQSRLDASVQEEAAAVARAAEAEQTAAETEARQRETQAALDAAQEQLLRARAEYDEAVAAQDRIAVELRTLRVAAEERAGQALPDLALPEGGSAARDLEAVILVARRLHDGYVESGRSEGQRLRDEAASSAETLLTGAREQCHELVAETETERDRLLSAAHEERSRLISEAEATRAGILADLNARRDLLEARVLDLDKGQEEYRHRLRMLVHQQLAALDDDSWRV